MKEKLRQYMPGDTVKVNGLDYKLQQEIVPNACKGCDFVNSPTCVPKRTDICRGGLIFKKVKK